MSTHTLLLISGSLRRQSINSAVLRTAASLAPDAVTTACYDEMARLPHFNPDDDGAEPPAAVARLRAAIKDCAALLFCVPEYAGGLPGSFKNLLDWTIGDDRTGSIYGKPVAWINASPRGAVHAHDSLRTVLGYAHAVIVEAACAEIPVIAAMVGADEMISDAAARAQIGGAVEALYAEIRS